jgi:hypothetical protein
MKRKILAIAALLALAVASLALAAPPAGKGKPAAPGSASSTATGKPAGKGKPTTGPGCRPAVTVVLKGTLVSVPGAGTSFTMTATSGNRFARAYVAGAQPVTVLVTPSLKVRRQGAKLVTDLVVGDRVLVQARACKADLANAAVPPLTAVRIVAKPAATTTTADPTETTSTTETATAG